MAALPDVTPLLRLYANRRLRRLQSLDPVETQRRQLLRLVAVARNTRFGQDHGFEQIRTVADFQAAVPLRRYEDFWRDYWQAAFPHYHDIGWPGRVPFLAVSSGTTSGASKFLPCTRDILRNHRRSALDVLVHHLANRPDSRIFAGKSFMVGGSTDFREEAPGVRSGDLSGIVAATVPAWAQLLSYPPKDIALMSDWDQKLETLARDCRSHPIRLLSGTPSWLLVLLERVMALDADDGLNRPPFADLDLLIHGGTAFGAYHDRFRAMLRPGVDFREVYPASEGFVAVADRGFGDGLRMQLDTGLFYEFVPLDELDSSNPTRHWIGTVETGVNYALVLSSCAGLWSYVIGDTVRLVDRAPPRLLVTGRTAAMLEAFGERLIVEELEAGVQAGAAAAGVDVTDFSAGAVMPTVGQDRGHHLFIVEWAAQPDSVGAALQAFAAAMDAKLSELNDDFRAHRTVMDPPDIRIVPPGTFAAWMKARGRAGGQNKVPRVIVRQELLDDLAAFSDAAIRAGRPPV